MQTSLNMYDCVVEVHDARIPVSGRNPKFDVLQVFVFFSISWTFLARIYMRKNEKRYVFVTSSYFVLFVFIKIQGTPRLVVLNKADLADPRYNKV